MGDLVVKVGLGCRGAACETVECACGVVVAAACGVGEGVVSVVDLLEAFCAGGALGGVGGDAVRVVF